MEENITLIKATITGVLGLLTTLWGWFGWLAILWIACMVLDYLTGSAAACKKGEWSSKAARDGIWHKLGSIISVLVAGILDLTIATIIKNIPGITLPFDYSVFFCPVMMVWCILTECGSIIENAVAMGAEIPKWLGKALAVLKGKVDDTMDVGGKE